jgi:hypothetical protein
VDGNAEETEDIIDVGDGSGAPAKSAKPIRQIMLMMHSVHLDD